MDDKIIQKTKYEGRRAILPAAWVVLTFGACGVWADEPPARPTAELITQLNDPRWCVREAASEELMARGPTAYEPLKSAFAVGASYEVRRRIKDVVREIHLAKGGAPSLAYLGIRMDTLPEGRVAPEAEQVARVVSAVECSAAETAGIQADDIISSINGKSLTAENFSPAGLAGWIQAQRPGTEGVLGVLRGATLVVVRAGDAATLDRLASIQTDLVDHNSDARVVPGASALKINTAVKISGDVDLAAGDLIVGVDPGPEGESFSPSGRRSLDSWIGVQRDAKKQKPPPVAPGGGRGGRLASPVPCLYVVRGGQWLDMPVRLGRPPERVLPELTQPIGSQRIADRLKAEAAFELWWQETFDPTGLVAENKSASDPSWRLTPRGRRG